MMMMMTMTPTRPSMMLGSWDSIRKSQVACKGWFNELVLFGIEFKELGGFVCLLSPQIQGWVDQEQRTVVSQNQQSPVHQVWMALVIHHFWWRLWWFTIAGEGCGDSPLLVKDFCFDSCLFCLVVREPVVEIGDNVNADPGIIGLVKRILCWEYFSCQNTV